MEQTAKYTDLVKGIVILVKVVSAVLVIVGLVQLGRAVIKTVAFNEYPLHAYELAQFDSKGETSPLPADQLEVTRKLTMLEDYAGAVALMLVSGGMYLVARKYTKS